MVLTCPLFILFELCKIWIVSNKFAFETNHDTTSAFCTRSLIHDITSDEQITIYDRVFLRLKYGSSALGKLRSAYHADPRDDAFTWRFFFLFLCQMITIKRAPEMCPPILTEVHRSNREDEEQFFTSGPHWFFLASLVPPFSSWPTQSKQVPCWLVCDSLSRPLKLLTT
jgi:hypothetical protein